jgi:lipid II:glycine glycyltransferase (peptidoglycan interpeptide bridge formation enzyme)
MDVIDIETANIVVTTHFRTVNNLSKLLKKLNSQLAEAHNEIDKLKEELSTRKKIRAKYTKTVDS